MRKRMKWMASILVVAMVLTLCPMMHGTEVQAASSKTKMKSLTKEFVNFAGEICTDNTWLNKTKSYSFSSSAARKKVAKYAEYDGSHKKLSYYAKKLFGKTIQSDEKVLVGDWGAAWPEFSFGKITKLKSGKYRISFSVKWVNEAENTETKLATGKLYVKPKKGSYYGYVATKLVIKRNNKPF
ncbi:hypothetical protein SAMN02910358_00249 [Lachnospiraceae bacterium XBB1006]|nr:hypothetical protein SAMN02910358_00249 [Lachnospiraceae bacterium XBB1006]